MFQAMPSCIVRVSVGLSADRVFATMRRLGTAVRRQARTTPDRCSPGRAAVRTTAVVTAAQTAARDSCTLTCGGVALVIERVKDTALKIGKLIPINVRVPFPRPRSIGCSHAALPYSVPCWNIAR